ncbi:MAG: helix-turn-helix domain-containing protein [Actinomycetota bacterium]|nr:helix-turn-helix domain-containing protein [Actinomycetota bacterium]
MDARGDADADVDAHGDTTLTDDGSSGPGSDDATRLAVFKALGDNTRYAIYLELARSPRPLATAEVAEFLGLHVNTVRPHLERMREAGLLDVHADARGGPGRPQNRYTVATDSPSLGLEPAVFPMLSRMLFRMASDAGLGPEEAGEAGREQGEAEGGRSVGVPCLDALVGRLADWGFDPAVAPQPSGATIAFTHCPFRELAVANPDLVCGLHRGLVEGFVDRVGGGRTTAFRNLVDRDPCQVDVRLDRPPAATSAVGDA